MTRWRKYGVLPLWAALAFAPSEVTRAHAQAHTLAGESALGWLGALSGVVTQDRGAHELALNGQRFRVQRAVTHAALGEVLDGFAKACNASGSQRQLSLNVVQAVCTTPKASEGLPLGHLRYLEAHGGPGEHTELLWLESTAPLAAATLFPLSGDAPGSDLAELPRPPGSRRVLALQLHGQPHGLVAYASARSESLSATLDHYTHTLEAAGYYRVPVGDAATSGFVRGDVFFVVHGFTRAGEHLITATRLAGETP